MDQKHGTQMSLHCSQLQTPYLKSISATTTARGRPRGGRARMCDRQQKKENACQKFSDPCPTRETTS